MNNINVRTEVQIDKILLDALSDAAPLANNKVQNLSTKYNNEIICERIDDVCQGFLSAIKGTECYIETLGQTDIDFVKSIYKIYLEIIEKKISSSPLSIYNDDIIDRFHINNDDDLKKVTIDYNNPHRNMYAFFYKRKI